MASKNYGRKKLFIFANGWIVRIKDTLYAKYIKEREGFDILENELGFLTYKIKPEDKDCFIGHMYIDESVRARGHGKSLIESLSEIALSNECEVISASVDLRDKHASRTIQAALRTGFQIYKAEYDVILIIKYLKGVK